MELLRNSKVRCFIYLFCTLELIIGSLQDKKARKLTKKRVCMGPDYLLVEHMLIVYLQLGTLLRAKRKIEELSSVIQESRRAGH